MRRGDSLFVWIHMYTISVWQTHEHEQHTLDETENKINAYSLHPINSIASNPSCNYQTQNRCPLKIR